MATYSKGLLSGSTNGKAIKVAATATPGTLIHTAVNSLTAFDEVWLYCQNTSTSSVKLTIEWGETTAPDGNIEITIPGEAGLTMIVPGLLLQNALVIRAFGATANVLTIFGYINRIQ